MLETQNKSVIESIFGKRVELLPSVTELFELELAYLEFKSLQKDGFIDRTAFFKSVNGKFSKHFLLYSNSSVALTQDRSAATQTYFENGIYSTGYATHGLFPYRGKFHPQLIKGLLNILGIEKGETILDPMCGSGTANIEAALMGINSFAVDISPFCQLMTRVKYEALSIPPQLFSKYRLDSTKLFEFFQKPESFSKIEKLEQEKAKVYRLALLAFLDALGYSKRVKMSTHQQLFEKVLKRYIQTVSEFVSNKFFIKKNLGDVEVLSDSEALGIKLKNDSIDCVITSPPYSFAIDYVENDKAQLEYLGYDIKELKSKMVGLKGKNKDEKLNNYFSDMNIFCSEVSRVLKKTKYFVMIIGSNTNQTGGIRLEETIINSAKQNGLRLVKSIIKPIKGMRNTMKDEYILFFQKD
jgi:DNA modification methylase